MKKRFVSLLVAACMILTLFPVSVFAADVTEYTSGDYKYTLNEDGTATITKYTGTESNITIPKQLENHEVTMIGSQSFKDNKSLQKIEISTNISTIDWMAFAGCTNLGEVDFAEPSKIEVLPFELFVNCSNLTTINIPSSVKEIKLQCFTNCTALTHVVIPEGVELIGRQAFSGCTNLQSIVIPSSSVESGIASGATTASKGVGKGAFWNCNNLSKVYYNGTQEQWNKIVDYDADTKTTLQGQTRDNSVLKKDGVVSFRCNVTFEMKGHGNALAAQTVYPGEKLTKVANPTDPDYTFDGWYTDAALTHPFDIENDTISGDTVLYAKWKVIPVAATMDVTTSKSDYLVNTPADVNVTVTPGDDFAELNQNMANIKVSLTYDNDVTSVMLNDKVLDKKEYTISELMQLMGQNRELKLNVTYGKAGTHTFDIALKNGDKIVSACGTDIVVAEEAAELTPATKLYTLTVKNADVTIKNGDEEIKAEKNDKGELIAKVPEKADVTVTYTSQSDAVAFDQWTITTDETLDVDVKNNPLKFQMPDGGVTIEAMTKDASIEEDEPNILGTAAVVGTAAVGTAILAWQGYQLGTELYLKTALPAGTAIPANRAELALLVWNHAGKPAPAAVLPADATDTQKAIAWAVENDLLKAAKDNGETYVDTDSVSRVEVIRVWNKAQEK
mgnify:FL=1